MNWHYFIAYGGWTDSVTGDNFVVCRCPEGRVPWSKKLMPRLHRKLKLWYGPGAWQPAHNGVPGQALWNVDGATEEMWRSKKHTSYEWTGSDWRICNFADKEKP